MKRGSLRRRMLGAPWWAWIPAYGIPFGLLTTFFTTTHRHHSWVGRLIEFAFAGLFFGIFMSLAQRSRLADMRAAMDEVPDGQHRSAVRASWRGPVPADPALRRSALAIAEANQRQLNKWWPISAIILFLIATSTLVLAITSGSVWRGLMGGFLVIMLGLIVWSRVTGAKRIDRLRSADFQSS